MRKLILSIESLAVQSFETAARASGARGTVHGHATPACPPDPSWIDACPSALGCTFDGCEDTLVDCTRRRC